MISSDITNKSSNTDKKQLITISKLDKNNNIVGSLSPKKITKLNYSISTDILPNVSLSYPSFFKSINLDDKLKITIKLADDMTKGGIFAVSSLSRDYSTKGMVNVKFISVDDNKYKTMNDRSFLSKDYTTYEEIVTTLLGELSTSATKIISIKDENGEPLKYSADDSLKSKKGDTYFSFLKKLSLRLNAIFIYGLDKIYFTNETHTKFNDLSPKEIVIDKLEDMNLSTNKEEYFSDCDVSYDEMQKNDKDKLEKVEKVSSYKNSMKNIGYSSLNRKRSMSIKAKDKASTADKANSFFTQHNNRIKRGSFTDKKSMDYFLNEEITFKSNNNDYPIESSDDYIYVIDSISYSFGSNDLACKVGFHYYKEK